ncbi:MAG: hypothetical protein GC181_01935 [Bacteroidetes bacterium]|nr:hypothetical protein [Bacteroidota bacterium]
MANTIIESDSVIVDRPLGAVFAFLSDLRNYEPLMKGIITGFSADEDRASLSVQGLGEFSIAKSDVQFNKSITLHPSGKLPFPFDIIWSFSELGDKQTFVKGAVHAELNMFMKMMAEGKLRTFVSSQSEKMKDYLESQIPA